MQALWNEREGRGIRLAVALWIVCIFFNSSMSIGPIDRVRLGDVASVILILVTGLAHRRTVIVWPTTALLILAMALLGLFLVPVAQDASLAFLGTLQLCEIGLVVVTLTSVLLLASADERKTFIGIFLGMAALETVIAVVQSVTRAGMLNEPTRGIGTLGLSLAFFLCVAWVYVVWRAICGRGRDQLRWLGLIGLFSAGLIASQTRTGWIAAIAAALLMMFLRRPRLGAATVVALVVGAVAASQLTRVLHVHSGPLERVDSLVSLARGDTSSSWTLTSARIAYWHASVDTIHRHPFGIGLKNFRLTLPGLTRGYLSPKYASAYNVESPHNQFLFTAVELGLVGAFLLVIILARGVLIALRMEGDWRLVALGLLLLAVIQLMLSDVLFGPLGMLFAALLAVAEWSVRHRRRNRQRYDPLPAKRTEH
jgi:O-antigen ligase